MNRRQLLRTAGGVSAAGLIPGCFDRGGSPQENTPSSDGAHSGFTDDCTIQIDAPESIAIRETLSLSISIVNDGSKSCPNGAPIVVSVAGTQPETRPTKISREIAVAPGGEDQVTVELVANYENLEAGALTIGDNQWAVSVGDVVVRTGTFELKDGPVAWFQPDEAKLCPVCNMVTKPYEGWHAQATLRDGSRLEFCSTGCAMTYWANPDRFEPSSEAYQSELTFSEKDDLSTIWAPDFTDVDTNPTDGSSSSHPGWQEFIDVGTGYVVIDPQTFTKYTTPMSGGSPLCFAEYDDAVHYCEENENVSEADIVELDQLSEMHVGSIYRGRYLDR
jgi:nitrous oxide reductase accessory protein NosL